MAEYILEFIDGDGRYIRHISRTPCGEFRVITTCNPLKAMLYNEKEIEFLEKIQEDIAERYDTLLKAIRVG